MIMKISMNRAMPVNLPSTIWVMLTGDESNRAREPLRFSSLINRIVSSGVTISNIMLAISKVGITTISVTPGALGMVASWGWMLKKKSIWVKNDHARMSCVTASTVHANGDKNMLRNSRNAIVKIMHLLHQPVSG